MTAKHVFLSYNRKDKSFADRFAAELKRLEVPIWYDAKSISPGSVWTTELAKGIAGSQTFVILLGPNNLGPTQSEELDFAKKLNEAHQLRIIPVLIPGFEEPTRSKKIASLTAKRFQHVDLRKGLNKTQIRALASTLLGEVLAAPRIDADSSRPKKAKCVLALTGGSGSGTGTLCKTVSEQISRIAGRNYTCTTLSMSSYYTPASTTRSVEFTNTYGSVDFDSPQLIDFDQMYQDVVKLKSGKPIMAPSYDKQKHATDDYDRVDPADVIILEGTFLLNNQAIREVSDLKLFVEVDPEVRFARRIWKDVTHYKVEISDSYNYYFRRVRPGYKQWVLPHRDKADLKIEVEAEDHVNLAFNDAARGVLGHLVKSNLLEPGI